MSEFSLRLLVSETWNERKDWDGDEFVNSILLRIGPEDRERALAQAVANYCLQFSSRRLGRGNLTLRERLERHTDRVGDCFVWTGKTASNGYGCINVLADTGWERKAVHRVSYEAFVGPIPAGCDIDHACHSRNPDACQRPCIHIRCWNPAHLRPLTHAENMALRRAHPRRSPATARRQEAC